MKFQRQAFQSQACSLSVLSVTSKDMCKSLAELLWIGLGNAGPWDSAMIAASQLKMSFACKKAATISGGTYLVFESTEVRLVHISDQNSCTFPPGSSKGTKIEHKRSDNWSRS